VTFFHLYVSPFIASCYLPVQLTNAFVFSAAILTWTIQFFAFPIPRSNFETARDLDIPIPH
jgi:hypothetical protein